MAAYELLDLVARVYSRLDDNTLLYPQQEVIDVVNEAIRILNLWTGYTQITYEIPGWSVADRFYYPVPLGIVIPLRVQFEKRSLRRVQLGAIGNFSTTWTTDTTANQGSRVEAWIPIGLRTFGIWPADSQGGQQMLITGVQDLPLLVNMTDKMYMPNQLIPAFDQLAVHTIQLKEATRTFAASSTDYQDFLRALKTQMRLQGVSMPRYWVDQAVQEVRQ